MKEIMQGSIEPLTLAVTGWMVRNSVRLLDFVKVTELLNNKGFKVVALIGMIPTRDPKLIKPLYHKNLGHSLSMLVSCRDSHSVFSKNSH